MNDEGLQLPQESDTQSPLSLPPEPQPPPSIGRRIFIGQHGLRAIWRLVVHLAMAAACAFLLFFLLQNALRPGRGRTDVVAGMITEIALFLAALVPAIIMGAFEHRSLRDYGLPGRGAFGKHFWVGAVWGIVSISVLICAMRGVHVFDFGTLALHGPRIWKWALWWGLFFLFVGFFEEFTFRGYTLFTLNTDMGFWPAAVVLSTVFGGIHLTNNGEGLVGALSAGLIGLFLAFTLRRTGSLWWAVGFHQAFDWGETYFYSVPDSGLVTPGHLMNSYFHGPRWLTGGTIGPEGSVLVFVLIIAMFVVFNRVYRNARWPVTDGSRDAMPCGPATLAGGL